MRPFAHWRLAVTLSYGLFAWGASVQAQAVEIQVGHFWDSTEWTTYRLGLSRSLAGVVGIQLHGDLTKRFQGSAGRLAGIGADLTAFRKREGGPYLVGGLSGGMGSETSNDFSDPWGSWSLGGGYDLFPLSFLSVAAEGRWRGLSLGSSNGVELAIGMAIHLGGSSASSPPTPPSSTAPPHVVHDAPPPLAVDSQTAPLTLADSVIATATEAMGRPYEYGGTGENGEGFDCSGLIQYAYAKHGIVLPRRSTDQARQGAKVDRKLERLRPGDLLTFSNRGGPVTHVGLYVGQSRFIHSATKGVQISTLSAADPYG
ncbi:MAG TPA: C40 family peptidase, partial [Gemmatimonadales bacterium]|nr:C40 family peptidase [Gemmatimonadales bacterium]